MSKSVEFSQNMHNPDVLSEIKWITESCNLCTEETVCKLGGVLQRCGEHMEVKGEKTTKANTERINQKWFDKKCEQLKKRKCQLLNKYRVTHTAEQLDEYMYLECKKGYKDLCIRKVRYYREFMKNK